MKKYECHVISNTHWDREWVKSFQESRVSLAEMFEKLFEVFENDEDYRYYHLDSQTIPLEDYHQLYPENQEKLKHLIRSKKLLAGPWYTLPEMNILDGECIVRNLLYGHRIALEYGGVMKAGYTPTSTGQVSQLPQVYAGFNINTIIFYRGINEDVAPAEYIWKSPDGTEAVAIRPPQHFSRCTFWGYVYLPVIHKYYDHIEESKQNYWSDNGFLFRLAEQHENEFNELDPVKYFDKSYLPEALNRLMKEIVKDTGTNVLLALHGHDASFPHEETPALIKALNEISEDTEFIHSNLEIYSGKIEELVRQRKTNKVLEGEMRYVNQSQPWNDAHLYPGVISTKGRLKRTNRQTENILIRHAEPAATLAYITGSGYQRAILEMAWKLLLANHAHDTINACSLDAVYHDAMHRYKQADDLCRQVLRRSLSNVVKKIDLSGYNNEDVLLTVFNLSPFYRDGVVRLTVDMPHDTDSKSIDILTARGEIVPLQVISRKPHKSNLDKTGFGKTHHSVRFDAWALFTALPETGYATFLVKPASASVTAEPMASGFKMNNEFLTVEIRPDGSFNLHDKETGKWFYQLNTFANEGELGNAWTSGRIPGGETYHTTGNPAEITLIENGHVKSTFRVVHTLKLPASAAKNYSRRSGKLRKVKIVSLISLFRGIKFVHIKTHFNNTIKDHRLRVLFPTGTRTDNYYASMPFDVVTRPVPKPSSPDWVEPVELSDPQTGFIGVSDIEGGLAIANTGLYEAEVVDGTRQTIAVTLLRSFYQHGNWTKERWKDEEFQNPGNHTFTYAVCPHSGTWWEGNIPHLLSALDNPLVAVQHGKGKNGTLPVEHSFLRVTGEKGLQLSCLKKAENSDDLIIRVFNPTPVDIEAVVETGAEIIKAVLTNLEEIEITTLKTKNKKLEVSIPHHKIVTLKLELSR
jgi:mannosylglycerate hydrolase